MCVYLYPHTDTISLITKEEAVVKKRRLHLYQIISRRVMIMRIYNIEWNRSERIQFETKSSRKLLSYIQLLTETKGNYCLFRSLINLVTGGTSSFCTYFCTTHHSRSSEIESAVSPLHLLRYNSNSPIQLICSLVFQCHKSLLRLSGSTLYMS